MTLVLYPTENSIVYIPFATYAGATGASVTLTGLAVTDIEIYKDGSTTQRASDAGYALLDTDGIDFDGLTGIHGFSIDLSDNTTAGFYTVDSWYWVVVSSITVDSQTVNFIPAVFQIKSATRGLAGTALPNAVAGAAGGVPVSAAGVDLDTQFSDLDTGVASIIAFLGGLVLHRASVGSTGNDTTHIHLDGLTYGDDEINSYLLVIYDASQVEYHSRWITDWVLSTELATVATLPFTPVNTDTFWLVSIRSDVTGSGGNTPEEIRDAVGLASADLDTQLGAIDDYTSEMWSWLNGLVLRNSTIGDTGNDTTHIHLPETTHGDDELNNHLLVIYDSSEGEFHSRWITDWVLSTELATVATLPFTPESEVDLYWLLSARADVTGGSGLDAAGVRAAIGMASADMDTQLGTIDANVDSVLADTNELQTDWVNGGRLDLIVDAILADTNELQTDDIPGLIAALNNLSEAQVNAQVVDALATDTYVEPSGVPAATATLATKIGYLHMALRNRIDVSATKKTFYDDGGAAEWEKDLSDDGTTYTETEANAI